MKKIIVLVILTMSISGCATVSYNNIVNKLKKENLLTESEINLSQKPEDLVSLKYDNEFWVRLSENILSSQTFSDWKKKEYEYIVGYVITRKNDGVNLGLTLRELLDEMLEKKIVTRYHISDWPIPSIENLDKLHSYELYCEYFLYGASNNSFSEEKRNLYNKLYFYTGLQWQEAKENAAKSSESWRNFGLALSQGMIAMGQGMQATSRSMSATAPVYTPSPQIITIYNQNGSQAGYIRNNLICDTSWNTIGRVNGNQVQYYNGKAGYISGNQIYYYNNDTTNVWSKK